MNTKETSSDILEKIKKLLRLAQDGRGATTGEAEAAMAMAQKLMTKFGIESVDMEDDAKGGRSFAINQYRHHTGRQRQRVDTYLASILRDCYGVKVLFSREFAREAVTPRLVWVLVGDKLDVDVACVVIESLNGIMNRALSAYFRERGCKFNGTLAHAFFAGLESGFIQANKKGRDEALLEAGATSAKQYGIVLVNKELAVQEFYNGLAKKKGKGGGPRDGGFDAHAYAKGVEVGKKVNPMAKSLK